MEPLKIESTSCRPSQSLYLPSRNRRHLSTQPRSACRSYVLLILNLYHKPLGFKHFGVFLGVVARLERRRRYARGYCQRWTRRSMMIKVAFGTQQDWTRRDVTELDRTGQDRRVRQDRTSACLVFGTPRTRHDKTRLVPPRFTW